MTTFQVWEKTNGGGWEMGVGNFLVFAGNGDLDDVRQDISDLCQQHANMICERAGEGGGDIKTAAGAVVSLAAARDDLLRHAVKK